MRRVRLQVVIGVVLFLAGGAALAFWDAPEGTVLGTLLGVTGLGLAGWGWLGRG